MKLARDNNGEIVYTPSNLANMNIFQFIWHVLIYEYAVALRQSVLDLIPALVYFVFVVLIVVTFPISMPIFAYIRIQQCRQDIETLPKT